MESIRAVRSVFLLLIFLALTTCGKDSPTGPPTPSSITVTPASATLTAIGQTIQLHAGVVDRNGKAIAGASVTWTSSNASVASVSPSGLVTAHQTGTTTIKATSSGVSGQAIVKVETPVVTGIILTAADTLLTALGQTKRINASVRDQTGRPLSGIDLTWSSSDSTVASVDSTGLVTAIGNGETDIMASAGSSVGTLRLKVMQWAGSFTVSSTLITMAVGTTYQLTSTVFDANGHVIVGASPYYTIRFPPDRLIVQVDRSTGLIRALEEGAATIHANVGGLRSVGIAVTVVGEGIIVQPPVAAVSLTPSFYTMASGDTLRFMAKATDGADNIVADAVFIWTSADESVAVVDSDGLVTALMRGLTTISAASGGASARATLTVTPSEKMALIALYDATNGATWTNSSGWLSDAPLGEWFGITTDVDGRVTEIDLNGNSLEGTMPPELGDLAWLESLDLGDNALSGPIPLELSRLDLKALVLDDTQLCVPETDEIISWLGGIPDTRLTGYCGEKDREVLIALYNATNGPDWNFNDGWLTDAPLNEWFGITTDRNGRVAEYKSSYGIACNGITGSIPPELGNLDKLVSLDLGCNRLIGQIPPELGNLTNLRYLNLGGNDLSGSIPPELGKLTNLEDLLISSTENLGGHIPPELGGLTKLKILVLPNNNLDGPIPSELGNLTNLEELRLGENRLSGQIPPEFGELTNLETMSLARNQLTDSIPPELGKLSKLKWLHIYENRLSGTLPPELDNLTSLITMDIENNELTGGIPEAFKNMHQLKHIVLSGNRLTGAIPDFLSELSELSVLMLASNDLTGEIPSWLGDLDLMARLHLDNTRLSGSLPVELANLTELWELRLNNTDLSGPIPAGFRQFTKIREFWFDNTKLCMPSDLDFHLWLQNIDNKRVTELCENPDREALISLYNETNGPGWMRQENWLSDLPLSEWYGVETDANGRATALNLVDNDLFGALRPTISLMTKLTHLSISGNNLRGRLPVQLEFLENLVELDLSDNNLVGNIPAELGKLMQLERLDMSGNGLLNGPVPEEFTQLENLSFLHLVGTQLCVPLEDRFRAWLDGISDKNFEYCESERQIHTRAYLTQAVQSLDNPVPLIAGESALLRVFVTTGGREIDVEIPLVRASFYNDGVLVHSMDIPGKPRSVPFEIDEGMAKNSANVLVPASVIQPGLEVVIEIDPDETLDEVHGIGTRLPETGRMSVEVSDPPPLHLTMVPFLWYDQPDRTILRKIEDLTPEDDMFWPTRDLLPVRDFELNVRDYVWTSVDPVFENIGEIARETRAIYALDEPGGYYMGVLRDVKGGIGVSRGRTSVVSLDNKNIAHELGHNFGLSHAPCIRGFILSPDEVLTDVDPQYPYDGGSIGVWGYDDNNSKRRTGGYSLDHLFEYGTNLGNVVDPRWFRDIMGYCYPEWISDYHFRKALEYRLTEETVGTTTMAASSSSLLIWGGVDASGDLVLEPAFAVEGGTTVSSEPGPYRVTGLDAEGRVLFSENFSMDVMEDSNVRTFAFVVPMNPSWEDRLTGVVLSGPEGVVSIGQESDRAMAMLRDRFSGQVRGFLRDLTGDAGGMSARRVLPEPGLDVVISRGVPAPGDW